VADPPPPDLPKGIRVGPYTYRVETYAAHGHQAWGRCLYREHRIGVAVGPEVSEQAVRTSLWHEVQHAVHELAGLNEGGVPWPRTEEAYIGGTCALWLMVLRDNPALVAFLTADEEMTHL
jgi:hypothetical protein